MWKFRKAVHSGDVVRSLTMRSGPYNMPLTTPLGFTDWS